MAHIDKTPDLGGKDYCNCDHARMLFDAIERAIDRSDIDPVHTECPPGEAEYNELLLTFEEMRDEIMDAYKCHRAAELAFEQNIEGAVPQ